MAQGDEVSEDLPKEKSIQYGRDYWLRELEYERQVRWDKTPLEAVRFAPLQPSTSGTASLEVWIGDHSVVAWSADYVYYNFETEGQVLVASIPRNPPPDAERPIA